MQIYSSQENNELHPWMKADNAQRDEAKKKIPRATPVVLYNTLSRKKEEFKSIEPGKVGMYVCGSTVYDYDHVGHARTYLNFDLLRNFLEFDKYEVKFVSNITDVGHLVNDQESGEDKVEKKAREMDMTAAEVADFFTSAHLKDLEDLNIKKPDVMPKASENIKEIIAFIEELINKGYAYITDRGNVYFNVAKDKEYGKLSGRSMMDILTGTRIESAGDKHSMADFALWKAAPLSSKEMIWPSPWGKGYPGWHIECSVMSERYLGKTFDIHGAAVELVFPHHENEIAQSESKNGQSMANYWVHSGMLTINGEKMSKSLHNTVTIQEALKTYSANEMRLAFYSTHYRRPFDWTKQVMEQGIALRKKLFLALNDLPKTTDEATRAEPLVSSSSLRIAHGTSTQNKAIYKSIIEALEDDLNTPEAISIWSANIDKINREDTDVLMGIFGLKFNNIEDNPKAKQLSVDREEARAKNDFLTADNRKAELNQEGFEVIDSPQGTIYLSR